MSDMEWIDIKLHAELSDAARAIARKRGVTVSQLMRDLIADEVRRTKSARPIVRTEERIVSPLQARLSGDLTHALSWHDLKNRLARKGYSLIGSGAGLALNDIATGRRVCDVSDLGVSYGRLVERIGQPFPGHPKPDVQSEKRDSLDVKCAGPVRPAHDITDEFDVIEPF